MLPRFLSRQVLRLRLDGGAEEPGPREAALGPPTVWLARGLCRFERVRAPGGGYLSLPFTDEVEVSLRLGSSA